MRGLLLLARRRARCGLNAALRSTPYERVRAAAFAGAGAALLGGLYAGLLRVLVFLEGVELIGRLIVWKLAAMLFLMTFSMTAVSSLLTSLTTLYHSRDLGFLLRAPLGARTVYLDKALESAFYASWTIALVLVPFAAALRRAQDLPWAFLPAFFLAAAPLLLLAASAGTAFTTLLLWAFPSSRTRDAVWALSSLFMAGAYSLARFSEPERLIRPDALLLVAEYLRYLQAPTAPWLPSWWLAEAARSAAEGRWAAWALGAARLWAAAGAAYAALAWLAGAAYHRGYGGAQEASGGRRAHSFAPLPEAILPGGRPGAAIFWKERLCFSRDVRHWSQMLLIAGLVFVYLFSIRRLPLDTPDLRNLICFLNVGAAGFVLSALGLRFTFPSVSLEGRAWWVLRSAPVAPGLILGRKFLFSAIPALGLALVLGAASNRLLGADAFVSRLCLAALSAAALTMTAMGVGFGARFPRFSVENAHQVESSLGGFLYMAACLFYLAAALGLLAPLMQMHFYARWGSGAWDGRAAALCGAALAALHAAAAFLPWRWGLRSLEAYED